MLSLLALNAGQVLPLETLIDRLWEVPPASAAHAVSVYISALRNALPSGERLRRSQPGYLLDIPVDAVDALRFERLVRDAMDALRAANAVQAVTRFREALGSVARPSARGRP